MGLVKVNDDLIPDRRINGARLRLDVSDWVKIFITIGSVFAIIITGWTSIRLTIEQQAVILAVTVKDTAETKSLARDSAKDIEFLKKSFDKIDNKLDKLINKN